MPNLPMRPCSFSGCPVIGPCKTHQRKAKPAPEVRLYDDRRGSSTARGYGYAWQQRRKEFIKRFPFCARCTRPTTDVDHVVPRSRGGSDDDSNLQPLCGFHHKQKTAMERRQCR
jgi:5-methylcytosine-specific restriction protein A